jgi:hypothetical protein
MRNNSQESTTWSTSSTCTCCTTGSSTFPFLPNVSTATTVHYTLLSQDHHSSSDNDETEPEEDYLSSDEEEDDDAIESLAEEDDDGISTHNSNRQITKPKNKSQKNNPVLALATCAEAYKASGNNKAILIAMGIGLKDLCVDINKEPYKSRNRQSFVPTSKELIGEIQHRASANGVPAYSVRQQQTHFVVRKQSN